MNAAAFDRADGMSNSLMVTDDAALRGEGLRAFCHAVYNGGVRTTATKGAQKVSVTMAVAMNERSLGQEPTPENEPMLSRCVNLAVESFSQDPTASKAAFRCLYSNVIDPGMAAKAMPAFLAFAYGSYDVEQALDLQKVFASGMLGLHAGGRLAESAGIVVAAACAMARLLCLDEQALITW